MRQAFNQSGDIDPTVPGRLTITLDPLPTKAKTAAIAELCEHLTTAQIRYPGTALILKYAVKNQDAGSEALNRDVRSPENPRSHQ